MNLKEIERIKKLALIAMFADDDLMDLLVLKCGNALDLVHGIDWRASWDLDFSMEGEFKPEDLGVIEGKIRRALEATFRDEGYAVFDVSLEERPRRVTADMADFWGGYRVEFKIIPGQDFNRLESDQEAVRRRATVVGPRNVKTFYVEISKFEYCAAKQESNIDGYTIYVYSPAMIVIEKLRSICQQMPEYAAIVKSPSRSARARDFFDIFATMSRFPIDLASPENIELLKAVFQAKRVPFSLIGRIADFQDFHRADFSAVTDTVRRGVELKDFDFYFNFVVDKIQALKSLWKE